MIGKGNALTPQKLASSICEIKFCNMVLGKGIRKIHTLSDQITAGGDQRGFVGGQ